MNPWKGLKGLPRQLWIIAGATLINRAGTMVLPFLVLYQTSQLGFSAGRAGFVVTLYGIGALIAAPLSGHLVDRFGGFRIMRESLLVSGLILLALPAAKSYPALACMVFLLALATEMFRPANLAVITGLVPAEQRKAAYGLVRGAINLGMSIGPALGGFLAQFSFHWLFIIDGATSIVAGMMLALTGFRPRSDPEQAEAKVAAPPASAFSDRRFLAFLLSIIPVAFVFFQHLSTMALFMVRDLGLPATAYGFMFTINTIMIVVMEVPINISTAHWSHRITLMLGCLLYAIGFGGLAFATGIWTVVATVVIWTFGEMILFPGLASYTAQVAPAGRQGQYMGLYTMAFGFAFSLAPWTGTYLLDHFGGNVVWGVMFIAGCLSALLLMIVVKKE
jgi:MFS family permease